MIHLQIGVTDHLKKQYFLMVVIMNIGLFFLEFPEDPRPSEDEMISTYVKTLAAVLGRFD